MRAGKGVYMCLVCRHAPLSHMYRAYRYMRMHVVSRSRHAYRAHLLITCIVATPQLLSPASQPYFCGKYPFPLPRFPPRTGKIRLTCEASRYLASQASRIFAVFLRAREKYGWLARLAVTIFQRPCQKRIFTSFRWLCIRQRKTTLHRPTPSNR